MFPTLDAIKGGGGSIRIGATGTIGSLMSRELDSVKKSPQSSKSSPRKSPTLSVSVPCVSRSKRVPRETVVNEAGTCGSSSNHRNPGSARKTRSNVFKRAHSIPMLGSDDAIVDNTPNRKKPDKKVSYIVEVVDVKCGRSNPIANQLRKLSFSKLSERIG